MLERVDQIGRIRWICPRCTWRAAGRCWQCGKRREKAGPRAVYCHECKRGRDRVRRRVSALEPEQIAQRRYWNRKTRQRPGYREHNTAMKRVWMAKHPEKLTEYAEKARLRYHAKRADPAWWERQKAMQRARYAKRKAGAASLDSLDATQVL